MMLWNGDLEALGFIPSFLDANDPRPAREQLDANYRHGGGWRPFTGFTLDINRMRLLYPGDPPRQALGMVTLRDETIVVFQSSWVAIVQPDGSHEIARMD